MSSRGARPRSTLIRQRVEKAVTIGGYTTAMPRQARTFAHEHAIQSFRAYRWPVAAELKGGSQRVSLVATGALQRQKYPNLQLKSAVLDDEDHLTVAPRGFTQGLEYLLSVR